MQHNRNLSLLTGVGRMAAMPIYQFIVIGLGRDPSRHRH
jgi:hypothetical protein